MGMLCYLLAIGCSTIGEFAVVVDMDLHGSEPLGCRSTPSLVHLNHWRICERHSTRLLEPQMHHGRLYRLLLEERTKLLERMLDQSLQRLEVGLLDNLLKR
jgi:hypothetical protein